ncbi:hypothetical protein GGS26DRAFT_592818 [Hypomontagnella submonticulosa]|nr:hypothetical protein GGS26DRAFT_592818 [Hypomontagnella submonticulosa]
MANNETSKRSELQLEPNTSYREKQLAAFAGYLTALTVAAAVGAEFGMKGTLPVDSGDGTNELLTPDLERLPYK